MSGLIGNFSIFFFNFNFDSSPSTIFSLFSRREGLRNAILGLLATSSNMETYAVNVWRHVCPRFDDMCTQCLETCFPNVWYVFTHCLKTSLSNAWRHSFPMFEDMLTQCLKTCLPNVRRYVYPTVKICLPNLWRHVQPMFEDMFTQSLKTSVSNVLGHVYPMFAVMFFQCLKICLPNV